jgi:hypothetical protein
MSSRPVSVPISSAVAGPGKPRREMMKKRRLLPVLGTLLLGSIACSGFSFLVPTATPTITLTPTLTSTPTFTPTPTYTPTPTRTLTPTKIPGIEEPVTVGDTQMQFQKALRRSTYICGTTTQPATNPDTDEFLLVTAKVINGPTINSRQDFQNWINKENFDQIQTVDDGNNYYDLMSTCGTPNSSNEIVKVVFAFEISKAAQTFVLDLPDGTQIPLDSIM